MGRTIGPAVCGICLLALGCTAYEYPTTGAHTLRFEESALGGLTPADTPPPEELPAGPALEDLLRYAALNNAGLRAAFERWQAAVHTVAQAQALPDPRLTYSYYIREVETRVGPQEQSVGLSQMFPWFGKRELRGDAAWQSAEAARMRYEAAKLKLFHRVKDAYYEYYYVGRAIGVVREQLEVMEYLEQVIRARYRAAAAGNADLVRAQVELGKLEDRVRSLEEMRGPVLARLNAALNRPEDTPMDWPESIPQPQLAVSDRRVLAWLAAANPELESLRYETERAARGVALARKDYYPDITLGLNYIDTGHALMPTPDDGKDPVIAMISLNLPIWTGKLRAGVREAEARQTAATTTRRDRLHQLAATVHMVLYRVRDAERKISLYRDTLIPKGGQSLNASQTAYAAGTATFLEVVDAVRMLLEFELMYERAVADHAQKMAELEMLVGANRDRWVQPPEMNQDNASAGRRE